MNVARRFRHWMRVVLPRGEFVLLCLLPFLLLEAVDLGGVLWNVPVNQKLVEFRIGLLSVYAFAFGVFRAFGFHPLTNDAYRNWLQLSPWRPGLPLPAGPVQLQPQDAVAVITLVMLSWPYTWLSLAIPATFLLGYLISTVLLNWATDEWALAATIAFGLCSLPLLHAHLEYVLPLELGCLVLASWATSRSFRHFPWAEDRRNVNQILNTPLRELAQTEKLGWPYDLLAPKQPKVWVKAHDGICISLLVGWLEFTWFTMLSQAPNPPRGPVTIFGIFPGLMASAIALIAATNNYPSPIDLWGRIRTLRLLIPKHDVLPATYLAAGFVTVLMHATFQIWLGAIGTAAALLIVLVFSPKVEEWRLTAPHRVKFVGTSQEYVQLQ